MTSSSCVPWFSPYSWRRAGPPTGKNMSVQVVAGWMLLLFFIINYLCHYYFHCSIGATVQKATFHKKKNKFKRIGHEEDNNAATNCMVFTAGSLQTLIKKPSKRCHIL